MLTESNKPSVLLVEDNAVLRESLTYLLSLHGYNTLEAMNGNEALETLSINLPDVILLDIMLGDSLDGFSILKIIKSDTRIKHIPVIIISALTQDTNILNGLELGANDYVVKPFKINELLLKVNNLVRLKANISENLLNGGTHPNLNSYKNTTDAQILKNFALLIESNLKSVDQQSVAEIADKLSLSISTLERLVKKNYGCNPVQYIIKRKLEQADLMLRTSNISVTDVASTMGFNSISYFSTCYKKYFGKSPLKNRKF